MAYPCESPQAVRYEALCAYIRVRCRRCDSCLKARQHLWVLRAAHEQVSAKRTWFVTLTFGPKRRAAILQEASRMQGALSQPVRLVRASGWFVTTFLKRLRKAGFEFRYLIVAEPHRDGFPHFHGLLHDQRGDLDWKSINAQWSAGFLQCKLVRDAGALRYVTKYLSKGRYGKIRASSAYGGEFIECEAPISVSVSDTPPDLTATAVEKEGREEICLPVKEGERESNGPPPC